MLLHVFISLGNVLFVFFLGIIAFWMFYGSIRFDKVRRSSASQRAEPFLRKKTTPRVSVNKTTQERPLPYRKRA